MMPSLHRNSSSLDLYRGISGMALSASERQQHGLEGLLAPAVQSRRLQQLRSLRHLDSIAEPLQKYLFLQRIHISDPDLFFSLLIENTVTLLPIVYTPSVGLACQKWSDIYFAPQGMYVPITAAGHVDEVLSQWRCDTVDAIVFSDGGRILGLGDLAANGMGIPIGKLALYVACAGIDPARTMPVILDCGTDNEQLLNDKLYIGLRQKRCMTSSHLYDKFVREFMEAAAARFGRHTLLQFEDFATDDALRLLEQNRCDFTTFNDDIQGTAAMTLAGLLAALPLLESSNLPDQTIVFVGAGSAGIGIANMVAAEIAKRAAVSLEVARKRIWAVDSRGLIVKDRPKGGLAPHKLPFAHDHTPIDSLEQVVASLKPTVLIGVSSQPNVFNQIVLETMAAHCERPVVFALSNPTSKAECTAEDVYKFTNGTAIFASGSPFPAVQWNGKTFEPGQANNVYVFPGIGLGALVSKAARISDAMLMAASEALATVVTDEDRARGSLYPPLQSIRSISVVIARAVAEEAFSSGLASAQRPADLEEFIRSSMYDPVLAADPTNTADQSSML